MMFQEVEVKKDGAITSQDYSSLVERAMRFRCEILLGYGSKRVNLKSIMGVLALGLKNDDKVTVVTKGEDEREALEVIARILASGFRKSW